MISFLLADMIMNLGIHGTTTGEHVLEQYSPELGFPKGFNLMVVGHSYQDIFNQTVLLVNFL